MLIANDNPNCSYLLDIDEIEAAKLKEQESNGYTVYSEQTLLLNSDRNPVWTPLVETLDKETARHVLDTIIEQVSTEN